MCGGGWQRVSTVVICTSATRRFLLPSPVVRKDHITNILTSGGVGLINSTTGQQQQPPPRPLPPPLHRPTYCTSGTNTTAAAFLASSSLGSPAFGATFAANSCCCLSSCIMLGCDDANAVAARSRRCFCCCGPREQRAGTAAPGVVMVVVVDADPLLVGRWTSGLFGEGRVQYCRERGSRHVFSEVIPCRNNLVLRVTEGVEAKLVGQAGVYCS